MKSEYYWTFRIESSRYYGEKDPDSLGFITEENREAWQEIMETECHQGYGMLNKGLMIDYSHIIYCQRCSSSYASF